MQAKCNALISRADQVVTCDKPAPYRFSAAPLCYNHAAKEALHYMIKQRIMVDTRIPDERRHYPTIKRKKL